MNPREKELPLNRIDTTMNKELKTLRLWLESERDHFLGKLSILLATFL